jgi:hypothetical protein
MLWIWNVPKFFCAEDLVPQLMVLRGDGGTLRKWDLVGRCYITGNKPLREIVRP